MYFLRTLVFELFAKNYYGRGVFMTLFDEAFGVVPEGVVNIDLDGDQELYVDSLRILRVHDEDFDNQDAKLNTWAYMAACDAMLDSPQDYQHLQRLLMVPREVNATRFGLGAGKPQGNGTSAPMLMKVFRMLRQIEGLKSTEHPESLLTFTPRFGPDRYSDLLTNIMARDFIRFTQRKCKRYNIPMTKGHKMNVFNPDTLEWEMLTDVELPEHNGLAILLVPKDILVSEYQYTAQEYVNHDILEGRKLFYVRDGRPLAKREIFKIETEDILHDKFKTYALAEAVREPKRFVGFLEKRQTLIG